MASLPGYAATPKISAVTISATADGFPTSATPTGGTTTLVTGGSSGSKVEEIVFQGIGTSIAGMVNIWSFTSATYVLLDQVRFLGVAGSTTASSERFVRQYTNLYVPSGTTLVVTSSVASQKVVVTAFFGDF